MNRFIWKMVAKMKELEEDERRYYYYYIHLTAFFQNNLGKPAPKR